MGYEVAPPPSRPAAAPAAPSQIDLALKDFTDLLGGPDSGLIGDFLGERDRLRGIGTGASDPAFAEFLSGQVGALNAEEGSALAGQSEFFGRRGFGDSAAALNAQNRTRGSFATQRRQLAGQVGLQALGRRDQAFADALGATTAAAETAATPAELLIAQLAAERSGKSGSSGGGGGLFGTVLCTEAFRHGDITRAVYQADCEWGRRHGDADLMRGYRWWATPLARASRKYPRLYRWIVGPMGVSLAQHFAYEMGVVPEDSRLGWWLATLLIPVCRLIGAVLNASVETGHGTVPRTAH